MTSHVVPSELLAWSLSVLGVDTTGQPPVVTVVAGDASHRRYFRLVLDGGSYILLDAPPATENNAALLAARELLAEAGVRVPELYGADLERGYLLLEDLGDRLLLAELSANTADQHYGNAFEVLLRLAVAAPHAARLPAYNRPLLEEELARFPMWFVEKLLGCSLSADECDLLARLGGKLVGSALEQPHVLVHRDFHSRNLMLQDDDELAVIDFQDAVSGPISYDLVSLLRDCYIQWPAPRVDDWARQYRDMLQDNGLLTGEEAGRFGRWFDWMGLQRHIKVLGTFARLYLRDGKPAYLQDLPLVIDYVLQVSHRYAGEEPVFAAFATWFEQRLSPLIARQGWSHSR